MDTSRPPPSNVVELRRSAARHPSAGRRLRDSGPAEMAGELVLALVEADLLWVEDGGLMVGEEPVELRPATVGWLRMVAGI